VPEIKENSRNNNDISLLKRGFFVPFDTKTTKQQKAKNTPKNADFT